MDITSYLLGKEAGGGGGSATLQNNKNVTIASNGTTVVNPDEGYDGLKKATITTNVQPNLETKEVTITSNTTTTITPTIGKDGLSSVSVITNIPQPTGTLNISANGTYDVTNYASAEVSIGGQPTKGVVFSNWDNDGYPTEAQFVGMSTVPGYYFYSKNYTQYGTVYKSISSELKKIVLPQNLTSIQFYAFNECLELEEIDLSNVTSLGEGAFLNCSKLKNITSLNNSLTNIPVSCFRSCTELTLSSLPTSLTSLGNYAFTSCNALTIDQIPDGVTTLTTSCFQTCRAIKKISMNNVTTVVGNSASNSSFNGCTGLKQVWIGSSITTTGLQRYAFNGCTSLEKIYINLPRTTVEGMAGYSYAFMNNTSKTGIIVCNDDTGFIDKATFDDLVIE